MKPLQNLSAAVALLLFPGQVQAASGNFADYSDLLATIWAISGFADACPQAKGSDAAEAYANWRLQNHIAEIENYADNVLMKSDEFAGYYRSSKAVVDRQVAELVPKHCAQLPRLLAQEAYQPAMAQKHRVDGILRELAQAGPAESPARQQAAAAAEDQAARQDAASIVAVVFDTRMRMGAGGVLWPEPSPVLLLQDGVACTDMQALAFPGGLAAHRQQHPGSWMAWRSSGNSYELKKKDAWKAIGYKTAYGPLATGTRLDGAYRRIGGSGTAAVGGADAVAAATFYRFATDGRFLHQQSAGSRAETADGSLATRYVIADRAGRYHIDGYLLTLNYGNGDIEYKAIVLDPKDPSTIWLNGYGYTD